MARRRDPLLERALLQTDLELGPQHNALRGLLSQLGAQYTRDRKVLASNAAGIREATRQARPDVAGVFDQALGSVNAQRAALGVGAGDPQAAAYERRVAEQKANALNELIGRETRAEEGRVYGGQVARDEYMGKKSQITGQLLDLAERQGKTAQSIYGKLRDERAGRAVTRRGQDVTRRGQDVASRDRQASLTERERHNLVMEQKATRDAKKAAKAKPWASQEQHAAARDAITKAAAQVPELLKDVEGSRAGVIKLLVNGVPAVKSKDGKKVLEPAVAPVPPDYARAAVNAALDKSLSRGDLKRLHDRRLKVKALGIPVRKPKRAGTLADLAGGRPSVSRRPPVPLGG